MAPKKCNRLRRGFFGPTQGPCAGARACVPVWTCVQERRWRGPAENGAFVGCVCAGAPVGHLHLLGGGFGVCGPTCSASEARHTRHSRTQRSRAFASCLRGAVAVRFRAGFDAIGWWPTIGCKKSWFVFYAPLGYSRRCGPGPTVGVFPNRGRGTRTRARIERFTACSKCSPLSNLGTDPLMATFTPTAMFVELHLAEAEWGLGPIPASQRVVSLTLAIVSP